MGWTGDDDTLAQVELSFPSAEAAIAYARRQNLQYTVQGLAAQGSKPRLVSDNPEVEGRAAAQGDGNGHAAVAAEVGDVASSVGPKLYGGGASSNATRKSRRYARSAFERHLPDGPLRTAPDQRREAPPHAGASVTPTA